MTWLIEHFEGVLLTVTSLLSLVGVILSAYIKVALFPVEKQLVAQNTAIVDIVRRIELLEKSDKPNCEAHRKEFDGKLNTLREALLRKIVEQLTAIGKDNIGFREDLRKGLITDDRVRLYLQEGIEHLRDKELTSIFSRLTALETRK